MRELLICLLLEVKREVKRKSSDIDGCRSEDRPILVYPCLSVVPVPSSLFKIHTFCFWFSLLNPLQKYPLGTDMFQNSFDKFPNFDKHVVEKEHFHVFFLFDIKMLENHKPLFCPEKLIFLSFIAQSSSTQS